MVWSGCDKYTTKCYLMGSPISLKEKKTDISDSVSNSSAVVSSHGSVQAVLM